MNIIKGKFGIKGFQYSQIVKLFSDNYGSYHYQRFHDVEGITALLQDETFDCICLEDDNRIIGFCGFYLKYDDQILVYSLSHLLLDKLYRSKGLGNILEDARYSMIVSSGHSIVIFASCVEKPLNSFNMKVARGFVATGIKYHYRPGNNNRENAVIMVKTIINEEKKTFVFEKPRNYTMNLLSRGGIDIRYIDAPKTIPMVDFYVDKDDGLRRTVGHIKSNANGVRYDSLSFSHVIDEFGYSSIQVDPQISGFSEIDDYLINNNFFPVSYIPYIGQGAGTLEYEYLLGGYTEILTNEKVSNPLKDIIRDISK